MRWPAAQAADWRQRSWVLSGEKDNGDVLEKGFFKLVPYGNLFWVPPESSSRYFSVSAWSQINSRARERAFWAHLVSAPCTQDRWYPRHHWPRCIKCRTLSAVILPLPHQSSEQKENPSGTLQRYRECRQPRQSIEQGPAVIPCGGIAVAHSPWKVGQTVKLMGTLMSKEIAGIKKLFGLLLKAILEPEIRTQGWVSRLQPKAFPTGLCLVREPSSLNIPIDTTELVFFQPLLKKILTKDWILAREKPNSLAVAVSQFSEHLQHTRQPLGQVCDCSCTRHSDAVGHCFLLQVVAQPAAFFSAAGAV